MGWGYGVVDGREVGYSVAATCDLDTCMADIDRGLAYCCGGMHGGGELGCGGYYCGDHLYLGTRGAAIAMVCNECFERLEAERLDDRVSRLKRIRRPLHA